MHSGVKYLTVSKKLKDPIFFLYISRLTALWLYIMKVQSGLHAEADSAQGK